MGILSASSKADAATPLKAGTYTLDGTKRRWIFAERHHHPQIPSVEMIRAEQRSYPLTLLPDWQYSWSSRSSGSTFMDEDGIVAMLMLFLVAHL